MRTKFSHIKNTAPPPHTKKLLIALLTLAQHFLPLPHSMWGRLTPTTQKTLRLTRLNLVQRKKATFTIFKMVMK